MEHAHKMANDPSPSVRREVALAMRYQPFGKSKDILLEIAKGYDGKDRYYVEAFGIGCTDKEEKIYAELKKHLRIQNMTPDTRAWFGVCILLLLLLRLNHGQ